MIHLIQSYCLCLVGDCAKMAGRRALRAVRSLYDTGGSTPGPSGEAGGSAPPQGRRRVAGRRPRAPPPQPAAAATPEPEEEREEEQVDEQAQQGEDEL